MTATPVRLVESEPLTRAEFLAEAAALRRSIAGYRQHLSVFCDAAASDINSMASRLDDLLEGVDISGERLDHSDVRHYFRGR